MLSRIINLVKSYHSHAVLIVSVLLLCLASFNFGKIYALKQGRQVISTYGGDPYNASADTTSEIVNSTSPTPKTQTHANIENTEVVASKKSSSKLYHFPWCPGAKQIADKNKITFTNEAAAIEAGYTLAGNCSK